MSTEIFKFLNALIELSPSVMIFLVSLTALVVVGIALIVLSIKQK